MGSLGTSIMEDLDTHPRTDALLRTTPSIAKSPFSLGVVLWLGAVAARLKCTEGVRTWRQWRNRTRRSALWRHIHGALRRCRMSGTVLYFRNHSPIRENLQQRKLLACGPTGDEV